MGFVYVGFEPALALQKSLSLRTLTCQEVFRSPSMFYTFSTAAFHLMTVLFFSHASGVSIGMALSDEWTLSDGCSTVVDHCIFSISVRSHTDMCFLHRMDGKT